MKTFKQFVQGIIPNISKRYEFYKLCQTPDKLIGMKVVAIRSGFSCGTGGGTKMTIQSIDEDGNVHLRSNEDTERFPAENGWGCTIEELPNAVIPYN